MKTKMQTYAVKIGLELFKVRGIVNEKGFLEWQANDGSSGISAQGKFCVWTERKGRFPECEDSKD